MDHDRAFELIEEYADEALAPGLLAEVGEHVRGCPECRAEVEAHRRLRRLALAAPPVEIPGDLAERIRERLRTASRPAPRPRRAPAARLLRPLAWVAGVAAAAVLLVALLPRRETRAPVEPAPVLVGALTREPAAPAPPRILEDWLAQAENSGPADAPFLAEEARALGLLPTVRASLAGARGAERRFLLAAEDVLIQLLNEPSPGDLALEARAVARARSR